MKCPECDKPGLKGRQGVRMHMGRVHTKTILTPRFNAIEGERALAAKNGHNGHAHVETVVAATAPPPVTEEIIMTKPKPQTARKMVKCPYCENKYGTGLPLNSHIRKKHKDQKLVYVRTDGSVVTSTEALKDCQIEAAEPDTSPAYQGLVTIRTRAVALVREKGPSQVWNLNACANCLFPLKIVDNALVAKQLEPTNFCGGCGFPIKIMRSAITFANKHSA